jgi:hypothetical protein
MGETVTVTDYHGKPLNEGARVEAWLHGVRYTATVKEIRPQAPAGYREIVLIRDDNGTEARSFSDAVVVIGQGESDPGAIAVFRQETAAWRLQHQVRRRAGQRESGTESAPLIAETAIGPGSTEPWQLSDMYTNIRAGQREGGTEGSG